VSQRRKHAIDKAPGIAIQIAQPNRLGRGRSNSSMVVSLSGGEATDSGQDNHPVVAFPDPEETRKKPKKPHKITWILLFLLRTRRAEHNCMTGGSTIARRDAKRRPD
jgi:hypothetical protein